LSASDISYQKMVKQIDKYWDKLFADPIAVDSVVPASVRDSMTPG
jgi:hypothetical protein